MPIVIPTVDEIERMDVRQRECVAKRIENDRVRAADSIAALLDRPRVRVRFVSNADIRAARVRSAQRREKDDAAAIMADARFLLKGMPVDQEAARHRRDILNSLKGGRDD